MNKQELNIIMKQKIKKLIEQAHCFEAEQINKLKEVLSQLNQIESKFVSEQHEEEMTIEKGRKRNV